MLIKIWGTCIFVATVVVFSCGKDEKKDSGVNFGPDVGCVQGVVVDGMTGARIPVPAPSNQSGIHVIVRNALLGASAMTSAESEDNHLKGEYTICGIPLESSFPLVAWVEGYQHFSANLPAIVSAVDNQAAAANGIQAPLRRPNPTDVANIRLYPVGAQARDFGITVVAGGEPVKDAMVYIKQVGTNSVATSGSYLAPSVERSRPLEGTTDENGKVNFTGDQLVLGGDYEYTVIPPEGASIYSEATGTFAVGLVSDAANDFPDRKVVALPRNVPTTPLAVVSTSLQNRDFNTTGKVVIYFNREIEFAPETKDLIVATLASNNTAALEADVPGNGDTETCSAVISGNTLTLTPEFSTSPDEADDVNMTVQYSGITVRSTQGANSEELGPLTYTVPVFN